MTESECKEMTRKQLLSVYNEHGLTNSIGLAEELLHTSSEQDTKEFRILMHGEICETVLEIMLREYHRQNRKSLGPWFLGKSWILKDMYNPDSDFCTELDLTLLTPQCIYIFECKSYTGTKELKGNGELWREGKMCVDVYKQNALHLQTLVPWVTEFSLSKEPRVQMCMFNFSNGELVDSRSKGAKIEMPCLDISNVIQYIQESTEVVWNIQALRDLSAQMERVSEILRPQHLEYVKSLHE